MKNKLGKSGVTLQFSTHRKRFLTTCAVMALIVGCTVTPKPLSDWERAVRVDRDIQEMFGNQRSEVIAKPITLYEAMARFEIQFGCAFKADGHGAGGKAV